MIGINPSLAGQLWRYIYVQLRDFKAGRRTDPQDERHRQGSLDRNQKISDAALCPMCHLGGFAGQNAVPRTAGLHYDYVVKQLHDF